MSSSDAGFDTNMAKNLMVGTLAKFTISRLTGIAQEKKKQTIPNIAVFWGRLKVLQQRFRCN